MIEASETLDFAPFVSQARAFLARFRHPPRPLEEGPLDGAFASTAGAAPDLYGAADAAHALFVLGVLEDATTPRGRAAWADRIRRHQDPATGWFDRSLLRGHGAPHATAFATAALRLLDAEPAHPLRLAETLFASPGAITTWLDGFAWQQIWTGSHAAGAAAAVLDAPAGLSLPADWGHLLLDALSERVDPATGFWKRALHDRVWRRPTTLDLGGAAHFWWLYQRIGRPVPHPARVVDGILGLQRGTGLWGSRLFGGAFPQGIDFDALHGLAAAWGDTNEEFRSARREALSRAIDRYAFRAHAMLTPPGAVERHFRHPHKLVGTLNALAALDALGIEHRGRRLTATPRPLRSSLERACWQ